MTVARVLLSCGVMGQLHSCFTLRACVRACGSGAGDGTPASRTLGQQPARCGPSTPTLHSEHHFELKPTFSKGCEVGIRRSCHCPESTPCRQRWDWSRLVQVPPLIPPQAGWVF